MSLALAMGTTAAQTATAPAPLRYEPQGPIVLHGSNGTAEFTLLNPGQTAVSLNLRPGTSTDDVSGAALTASKVSFSVQSGEPLPPKLDAGAEIAVVASVSGFSGASVATLTLFNGDSELGKLHLAEADAPLNIAVNGNGSSEQKLVMTDGEDAILTLKNYDSEAYPLGWSFEIGGKALESGELQLAANGTARIELTPAAGLFSWTNYLRPSDRTGTLVLNLNGPPEVPKDILPTRTLHVNLLMRKLSAARTSLLWRIFVALILLVGGLLSVIANAVLPNVVRRNNLRRQLSALAERKKGVNTRVDSYLRTLISLERKRIEVLLGMVSVVSLVSTEKLDELSTAIDQLGKRLKAAERLDEVGRKLEEQLATAPPSMTEAIEDKLQMAAVQLQPFTLTAENLTAANGYIDAANTSIEALANTAPLATAIAANFKELRVRQKLFPNSYYADMKAALPGLFEMLNQPFDEPSNITRPMMFAIDYGIAALQLAFDYASLRANTSAAAAESGAAAGQRQRDRLLAHHEELIGLLGTLSRGALRDLRTLVAVMSENIYESDVLNEIAARNKAEIAMDPQTARAYAPVFFSVRFKDPRLNGAAALRRLTFKWEFPNFLLEQREKVCHFFRGNEPRGEDSGEIEVSVRVETLRPAAAVATADGKAASTAVRSVLSTTLEIQRPARASYSRAIAESARFLIAYGVALAALLSGALQQLDKLDFIPAVIAILALGFGADTVKNLLTQTARKASA